MTPATTNAADITFGSFRADSDVAVRKAKKFERLEPGREQKRAATATASLARDTATAVAAALEAQQRENRTKRTEEREQFVARTALDTAARRAEGTTLAAAKKNQKRIDRGQAVFDARKTLLARHAAISEETRRKGREQQTERKAAKIEEKRLRQALAVGRDEISAPDETVPRPALHARAIASRDTESSTRDHGTEALWLVDTAAGRSWVTSQTNNE